MSASNIVFNSRLVSRAVFFFFFHLDAYGRKGVNNQIKNR